MLMALLSMTPELPAVVKTVLDRGVPLAFTEDVSITVIVTVYVHCLPLKILADNAHYKFIGGNTTAACMQEWTF